jgi:hypothetical protein
MATGRKTRRQQGVALILTLLVFSILVVVVTEFSYRVQVEKRIVANGVEDQEMTLAARGVIAYLATLFRDDAKDPNPTIQNATSYCNNYDDPNLDAKLHTLTVGDIQLTFRVEDLERRLSLEWFADDVRAQWTLQALTRLLTKLGVDKPDEVALKIGNYVRATLAGKQALTGPTGGAPGQPPAPAPPPPPPPAPNAPPGEQPIPRRTVIDIECLLDIQDVEGMDKILYGDPNANPPKVGLAGFITCWPTPAININTVLYELMFSILPQQTKAVAGGVAPSGPMGAAPPPGQQPTQAGGQQIDLEALCKKIRGRRIDPLFEQEAQNPQPPQPGQPPAPPPPPPPPPAQPGQPGQGSGASKSWNAQSKSFQQVSELSQFPELAGWFPAAPTGQPGQPAPPPPPPPPAGQPGVTPTFDVGQALCTQSRFFAIYVKAQAPSGNTKVVRIVVERNKQNQASPLLVREEPK